MSVARVGGRSGSGGGAESSVWMYFEKLDNKKAQCNICKQPYSYSSTTSNLKKHLRLKHISVHGLMNSARRESQKTEACFREDKQDTRDSLHLPQTPASTLSYDDEEDYAAQEQVVLTSSATQTWLSHKRKCTESASSQAKKAISKEPKCSEPDTKYDYASRTWVLTLQGLPKDQQLFATRMINEVLFEAQLGNLSRNTKLCCEDENQQSAPTPLPYSESHPEMSGQYEGATKEEDPLRFMTLTSGAAAQHG